MNDNVKGINIYSMATDPIYIGTGDYTIGRVDNTIVRDPTTKIPKIPGSSLAGTWRYYVALKLISNIKELQPKFDDIKKGNSENDSNGKKSLAKKVFDYNWKNLEKDNNKSEFDDLKDWLKFKGNQIAKITCAGQDNVSTAIIDAPDAVNKDGKTGHCGHCMVCKSFGYSKANQSWQGMLFFSDLNILFFPVYTRLGVRWITSPQLLKNANVRSSDTVSGQKMKSKNGNENYLNLGWLNLEVEGSHAIDIDSLLPEGPKKYIESEKIILISDSLISQVINSNLEVRTSVSINPITGAAKERALFTSEAIPRGTIFYGNIRIFDKNAFNDINPKLNDLPDADMIKDALCDSKHFYETLGIGGMTTRGFGRMRLELKDCYATRQPEKVKLQNVATQETDKEIKNEQES